MAPSPASLLLLGAALPLPCAALRNRLHLPGLDLPGVPIPSDNRSMPAVGFGTCCRQTSRGPALTESARTFLRLGGRHIDTAQKYQNHRDLRAAISGSGVPRGELWITDKVNTITQNLTREGVLQAVNASLQELGLDYVDLMLLHRPAPTEELRAEQWRGLIDARGLGLVRSIGVSNYDPAMIQALVNATGVRPAVNQLSFNAGNAKRTRRGVRWCMEQGIAVIAYASLKGMLEKEVVTEVGRAHGASPSQVLLRWALDQGCAVIPGATSEEHIRDNLSVGNFHIEEGEARRLEDMFAKK